MHLLTSARRACLQVNNTVIDWFEPWPEQALHSVATVFLAEEKLPESLRPQIVEHMITVHQSVRTFSARFQVRTCVYECTHVCIRVPFLLFTCLI
jgi:dynein heavy chain